MPTRLGAPEKIDVDVSGACIDLEPGHLLVQAKAGDELTITIAPK